ncbi:MAG: cytochrome P450 [Pseudomonadota bacterium]
MIKMKYYDRINELRSQPLDVTADDDFDYNLFKSSGMAAKIANLMINHPYWWQRIIRNFFPLLTIGKISFVARDEDVREVLERQDVFETPFGPDMVDTNGGVEAVLGMQDGPAYRITKDMLARAFRRQDIAEVVTPVSAQLAQEAVAASNGRIDAVQDLITAIPVRVARDYYGYDIKTSEERAFSQWAISMSTLYFADFAGNADVRRMAIIGSKKLERMTMRSLEIERLRKQRSNTPLGRLVEMQSKSPDKISDGDICGAMVSMIAGFVPTNTMAAGHMLDIVMSKAEAFDASRRAALANEDQLLNKCLLEAMRFRPLNPGPLRYLNTDTALGVGQKYQKTLKAGSTVIASTQSAMMDDRVVKDPLRFNPNRPDGNYMLYGHGIHWCIGAHIANSQITHTLKALLVQRNLRRAPGKAGRLNKWGAFPESMWMEFDPN